MTPLGHRASKKVSVLYSFFGSSQTQQQLTAKTMKKFEKRRDEMMIKYYH